jgi:hypothetical protein
MEYLVAAAILWASIWITTASVLDQSPFDDMVPILGGGTVSLWSSCRQLSSGRESDQPRFGISETPGNHGRRLPRRHTVAVAFLAGETNGLVAPTGGRFACPRTRRPTVVRADPCRGVRETLRSSN